MRVGTRFNATLAGQHYSAYGAQLLGAKYKNIVNTFSDVKGIRKRRRNESNVIIPNEP